MDHASRKFLLFDVATTCGPRPTPRNASAASPKYPTSQEAKADPWTGPIAQECQLQGGLGGLWGLVHLVSRPQDEGPTSTASMVFLSKHAQVEIVLK